MRRSHQKIKKPSTATHQQRVIARVSLSKHGQKSAYPTGPRYPMTDEWKADVRRRMKELGINQTQLAKIAGVSRGGISRMLGEDKSSACVPAVSKALGIPMPHFEGGAALLQRINALDDQKRRLVFDMVDQLEQSQQQSAARHSPSKGDDDLD